MDDFFGWNSSDGGTDGVLAVLFGVRVTLANTPDKIRAILPNGGRGWLLQKPCEYGSFLLRASRTTKIINRKSAKEMTSCTRADGDIVMVFVLATGKSDTGGSGGINADSDSMSGLSDIEKLKIDLAQKNEAMAEFNRSGQPSMRLPAAGSKEEETNEQDKPTVHIRNPEQGAIVIRRLRGIDTDGSSTQADSVNLTWKSTSSGNESITSNSNSWDGILSLDPNDYELTATNGGVKHTVNFTVILKEALTGYTAEDIQLINSFKWGSYNKSDAAQLVQTLAREAGLVDKDDDFSDTITGASVVDKVKSFASNAKGDFNLYYSASGDKAFIAKKIKHIFGTHLSDKAKIKLIADLERMKKAGFIDATDAFHDAMKNTLDIFFAKNSVGRTISEIDIPLYVNPVMILVMDGAKKAVSMKLNYELSQVENGAPLLLRNRSAIDLFDAIGVEVVGAVAGGVVVKAGSKAFKVLRSFFGKYKFRFRKKTQIDGGTKSNWSKELNNPKPNTEYLTNSYTYKTDNLGRVKNVEGELKFKTADRNTYQQSKSGKSGNKGDEGGHQIASIFNGPGEKINLLPMNSNLNKGAWKKMENKWADELKAGKKVEVNISPEYIGNSTRPSKFIVEYKVDGKFHQRFFNNNPGG